MKHYSREEWLIFKKDGFDNCEMEKMEDHLYSCDLCMKIFLDVLDDNDITKAEESIPDSFTRNTLIYIKEKGNASPSITKRTEFLRRRQNLFTYYVAAAVLTLVFMGGGVFQSLVDNYASFSQTACTVEHQKMQEESKTNISIEIANRTSQWINNFENKN